MTIIDSYSETNSDTNRQINNTTTKRAQSFTSVVAESLYFARFYIGKSGSPTGNATAVLYAHTGTYGVDGTPTGAALATSDNVDVSLLTTTKQLVTFKFSSPYAMSAATNYFISLEYGSGDASNYLIVGTDTSSPSHAGNTGYYTGSWAADATQDHSFYVHGAIDKTNTVIDIFSDNSINSTLWWSYTASSGTVTETNNRLEIQLAATTNGSWSGIYSKNIYDLTSSKISVELVAGGTGNSYVDLTLCLDQSPFTQRGFISIGVDAGLNQLQAYQKIAGSDTTLAYVTYDPQVHKWIRLRESGGTTYWEYSTTGIEGNWTTLASATSPMDVSAVYIVLDDYEYNALSTPAKHIFDNLNQVTMTKNSFTRASRPRPFGPGLAR
jgi:hypothetical protein